MKIPTCEEIYDKAGLKKVHSEVDDGWRHGVTRIEVYKRESDNTFWEVGYRVSTDGETNELREGTATIFQVEPVEVKTIKYQQIK